MKAKDLPTVTWVWDIREGKPGEGNSKEIEVFSDGSPFGKTAVIATAVLEPELFRRVRFEGGDLHILPAVET